jgi:hypothetical protein
VWRKTLNSTTSLAADGSYNGVIDAADYNLWRSNVGAVIPASGESAHFVPEPQSWLAPLSIGWLLLSVLRMRQRKKL